MLRNILMFLGLLVSFLPYLGFPYEWNRFVWTTAGLLIFFLVFFSRRGRVAPRSIQEVFHAENDTRSLHVERHEVKDRPLVHIERDITVDTTRENETDDIVTVTEKSVTVKRKSRKQQDEHMPMKEGGRQDESQA